MYIFITVNRHIYSEHTTTRKIIDIPFQTYMHDPILASSGQIVTCGWGLV